MYIVNLHYVLLMVVHKFFFHFSQPCATTHLRTSSGALFRDALEPVIYKSAS